jgi:hypothetical protein
MPWKVRSVLNVAFAVLVCATVLIFVWFDRRSHSASDTLRPFLLTMVPLWLAAIAGARLLNRRSG